MGDVAGIALNHLNKQLKTEKFAEILPFWPPGVTHSGGLVKLERKPFEFHYSNAHNIITFSGPFQPNLPHRLYELCKLVADVAEQVGVRRIYTVGAAYRGSYASWKVYGVASHGELLAELKSKDIGVLEGEGEITGFNGLMLGIAMEKNTDAICLLSEIDDPEILQPLAAAKAVEALGLFLNLNVDLKELENAEKQLREEAKSRSARRGTGAERRGEPPGII